MIRRIILAGLVVAVVAVTGYAAGDDNATPIPGEIKSPASGAPSYFEGVWVGSWPSYLSPSVTQAVTLKIDKGKQEGVFLVEYSWEAMEIRGSTIPPGSIKTKGREEGDRFIFKWQNKQGRDFEMTLNKYKDDVVKARLDRSGPYRPTERPFSETTLTRK